MKLLTIVTLHFAALSQAVVKVDWAIKADKGASLGDCVYSLLHEHKLGAKWIYQFSPKGNVSICTNKQAVSCDPTFEIWDFVKCVQRYDVYYFDGHRPQDVQTFANKHGTCQYDQYSNNAGGEIFYNNCRCSDVGRNYKC